MNFLDANYNKDFVRTITNIYGDQGAEWLKQLPSLVNQCVQKWDLTDLQPYQNLTYNYVLFGNQHELPIVLKMRCGADELRNEVAALQAFNNYGCVKNLDYDKSLGALLLERAVPGEALTSLFPYNDRKATAIAADLLQKLHKSVILSTSCFQSLDDVLSDLHKDFSELAPFIVYARTLRKKLLSNKNNQVLLHGDFHHGNIVSASDSQWVAIDPEGIVGSPLYDVALFIRNPLKELVNTVQAQTIIATRIQDFAQLLGYSEQSIYEWTYLQAVISAYWSLEDGLDAGNHIKFLVLLEQLQI